jgi:molybdenum cofactor synthesis domain-containing protein
MIFPRASGKMVRFGKGGVSSRPAGRDKLAVSVGIVILGDEVLNGEIREANLAYMIPLLNEWGARVALCAILPDDVEVVVRHLRAYLEEVDLLVLTGGIGPTPDDITRDAVARAAGVPLVVHPEAEAALLAYYKDRINEYRMLMAKVPDGAELIPNPISAAPGFHIARMAVFPGIPRLLHEMFPWIRRHVAGKRTSRVILHSSAPESGYAGMMKEAMDAFPEVGIGSYPTMEGSYRVRVVFRAADLKRASACADFFAGRLRDAGWEISLREEVEGG